MRNKHKLRGERERERERERDSNTNKLFFFFLFLFSFFLKNKEFVHSLICKKSWYKVSTAGGEESSNQYISSMIFLTCRAKECATIFHHPPPPPSSLFNAADWSKLQPTDMAMNILKDVSQQIVVICEARDCHHHICIVSFDHQLWEANSI